MRIQLGTSSNNAANYCLVYNYYAGVANPTTCTAAPTQAATGNNGNVMGYLYQDAANTSLQHSVVYTFDGVNRLASATAKDLSSNTLWAQSYIYTADSSNGQFGNMTCMLGGSGYCPQVTFSASTNRVSKVGSLNASHDPAGNMTGDGTHTYQWDAENRMVSVDSGSTATQNYNALGQRVERFLPNGSWTFDYLFGLGGEELGLYSAGTAAWFDQNVPMAGRVLVMYGSPSRFLHANKLGTTTVTTDQTGSELQDELFYPWGQNWTRAGQPYVMHFAGMQNFENPGLVYPTDFRKYNPALGRWMSPDPLAGDVSNPQSLNRYAYVLNNPVSNTDPSGLSGCNADDANSVDTTSGPGVIHVTSWAPCPTSDNVGLLPPVSSGHLVDSGRGGSSSGDKSAFSTVQRLACAADFGQNHSVASWFGAQNTFLGNLFGGNTVSGLANLYLFVSGDKAPTAGQLAAIPLKGAAQGIPVPPGSPGLSGAVGQARAAVVQGVVTAGFNAVAGVGAQPIELGITASAKIATSVAPLTTQTLGQIATGVGAAKFAFDLGTFLYGGIFACGP